MEVINNNNFKAALFMEDGAKLANISHFTYQIKRNEPIYELGSRMPSFAYSRPREVSGTFTCSYTPLRNLSVPLVIKVETDRGTMLFRKIFVTHSETDGVEVRASFLAGDLMEQESNPTNNQEALKLLHKREV